MRREIVVLGFALLVGCESLPPYTVAESEPTMNDLLWRLVHILNAENARQYKECHDYMNLVHQVCSCPGDKAKETKSDG